MSILVKEDTRILVQGITGDFGARHARLSLDYGSQVVAGVTPGKGGQVFEHAGKKVPIFNTVAEAAKQTGATVSAIFVPRPSRPTPSWNASTPTSTSPWPSRKAFRSVTWFAPSAPWPAAGLASSVRTAPVS